uniref:Uncharacterized protein n=1 Tax=Arundo donax TaxID=35708 RepID=A0A0A9EJM3_ARUDO
MLFFMLLSHLCFCFIYTHTILFNLLQRPSLITRINCKFMLKTTQASALISPHSGRSASCTSIQVSSDHMWPKF